MQAWRQGWESRAGAMALGCGAAGLDVNAPADSRGGKSAVDPRRGGVPPVPAQQAGQDVVSECHIPAPVTQIPCLVARMS